jgi:hypothetical protein
MKSQKHDRHNSTSTIILKIKMDPSSQIQNALLISASTSMKTGNMALDMVLLSVLTPMLIYLVKLLFENISSLVKYIVLQFQTRRKRKIRSEWKFKTTIKMEQRGKSDNIIQLNYYNDFVIKGLSARLLKEGCMKEAENTVMRIDVPVSYELTLRDRLLRSSFILHPEIPVMYNGMEFTFDYTSKFDEEAKTDPLLKTENAVTIRYNDHERLEELLQQCKKEQVGREYPSTSTVDDNGKEPLYIYKMTGNKNANAVDASAPKKLEYYKIPFDSSRTFESLYFDEKDNLLKSLDDYFNKTGAWDVRLERPHKCVIAFSGIPGSGKTSCIKAMARKYGLHIVVGNLSELRDNMELQHFFFDQTLSYRSRLEGRLEYDFVPTRKRLILLEDLDAENCRWLQKRTEIAEQEQKEKALTDSKPSQNETMSRSLSSISETECQSPSPSAVSFASDKSGSGNNGVVISSMSERDFQRYGGYSQTPTLSGMLNLLDGILELNSVVVITTNNLNYFDSAFLRPARIDLALHLSHVTKKSTKEYLIWYYQLKSLDEETLTYIEKMFEGIEPPKITPAELQEMCQNCSAKNNPNPISALKEHENVIKSRKQVYT